MRMVGDARIQYETMRMAEETDDSDIHTRKGKNTRAPARPSEAIGKNNMAPMQ